MGKKSTINKLSPGMFLLRFHLEGMTHMSATRSLKKHVEGMTIETEMSWEPSADKRFLPTCLRCRMNLANNLLKIKRIPMHLLSTAGSFPMFSQRFLRRDRYDRDDDDRDRRRLMHSGPQQECLQYRRSVIFFQPRYTGLKSLQ